MPDYSARHRIQPGLLKLINQTSAMRTLLFILLITSAAVSHGYFLTAGELSSFCEGDAKQQEVCVAFILGVADTHKLMKDTSGGAPFCMPSRITGTQLRDIFLRHRIAKNMNYSASGEVTVAFINAFPCK